MSNKQSRPEKTSATKLISRVIRYMLQYYKIPFLLVIVCILITAIATVVGATFPQTLVDDYITPMLANGSDDFSGLAADLLQLACVMAVGVITAFSYNRIMVNVSQGTMRHLRDDLFRKMEALPIKYFDTHAHGDIETRTNLWAWKHPHKAEGTVTYTKLEGAVVFDDVDFGYTDDKIVLHNISLWAKPGQKIAFVGATGAGKTTITNLINRFYDIADGKIRYDGININKIKKQDLRRSLGMVLQDTHLFTGTVMDNIRYGKLDATDEECIKAAKLANADGFIRRLPDGYNTMLTGDGANLSQGQRQLLAIARAAVADPPALILDEATSSIDTRTEKLVQDGMDALMKGRTTFVIAHRLSTVKNSDCIMVMEQGRIIERGTHDDLIAAKGKYYQLYTGNFAD